LELVAHTIYSPVSRLVDQLHPNWPFEENETYVCNGAFTLKRSSQNKDHELEKNCLYWDKENIRLEKVFFVKVNRYQAYEMFQNNNNDWIGPPLGTWDPSFLPSENDEFFELREYTVYWYVFNTQRFPFNNKKIRQAFALAVNRPELERLFDIIPAITPMPSHHTQVPESILSSCNLEKAQALFIAGLEEIQLSPNQFPVIPLIVRKFPVRIEIAEFIKQQWERVFGVRCVIQLEEWNNLFSKMTEGDYQMGEMGWETWVNDPIYTLNAFRDESEAINFSKWQNSEYQAILHSAEGEIDPNKRQLYYRQAEEILLDEMPVIPLFSMKSKAIKKKNLRMYSKAPLANFKWAYFEPSL
jgi:oligopeptide transport system substrate-binding protein